MNSTNLVRFEKDGIEVYVDNTTGESFATVSGYSRISEKAKSTIQSRVDRMTEGERINSTKEAELFIGGGLQGVRLLTEQLICEWLPKDNPEMATKLMQLGVRVFLQTVAGYEVKTNAISKTSGDPKKDLLKSVLDDMWSDIAETFPEIDKRLIKGAKLNGYGRLFPELKGDVEEAKHLISATSVVESLPLSPTELGIKFAEESGLVKVSAQKVNLALVEMGLQVKTNNKLCTYELTEEGEKFGELQLETASGHNKTVYRIRWYDKVLPVIRDTLTKLSRTNHLRRVI